MVLAKGSHLFQAEAEDALKLFVHIGTLGIEAIAAPWSKCWLASSILKLEEPNVMFQRIVMSCVRGCAVVRVGRDAHRIVSTSHTSMSTGQRRQSGDALILAMYHRLELPAYCMIRL